jgi:hypothetical protein
MELTYFKLASDGSTVHHLDGRGQYLSGEGTQCLAGGFHVKSCFQSQYLGDACGINNVSGKPLGVLDLKTAVEVTKLPADKSDPRFQYGFGVTALERCWEFWAEDDVSRAAWMQAIADIITPAPISKSVRCQGWLYKQGGFMKNWKRRWFVVTLKQFMYFEGIEPYMQYQSLVGQDYDSPPPAAVKLPLGAHLSVLDAISLPGMVVLVALTDATDVASV